MLKRVQNTNGQLIFSWIKLADISNLKNPISPATRRDSPLTRIYKKIKSSLEKEKKQNSNIKNGVHQKINTQTMAISSNLKENVNNSDGEFEEKNNKMTNGKILKLIEGLNTTVANLDVTFDEDVDFENERIKRSSRDTEDLTDFNNTIGSKFNNNEENNIYLNNQNIIIKSSQNNEKIENKENNEINSEIIKNLNLEFEKNMNNTINNNDIQYNINSNHKDKLNPIYKDNNNDYLNKINSKIDSEALVKNNNF